MPAENRRNDIRFIYFANDQKYVYQICAIFVHKCIHNVNAKLNFLPLVILVSIFCTMLFTVCLLSSYVGLNLTFAQIEITTDENVSSSALGETLIQDDEPNPDILYSALNSDEIVGEVQNNFTYPIELVRITATICDKNGLLAETGETYTNDYQIKPGDKTGFDIYLDKELPSNSKYTLTASFNKSEDNKPESLELIAGKNSKDSRSFRFLGEVLNQGRDNANSVKVSGIFYDENHKVVNVGYTYTNPDTISPNRKAPFELSFYTDNPEKIGSMAINVQSDEYSLITNTTRD